MDPNSTKSSQNPANGMVPSDDGLHRPSGLEDNDPAVWLDQFLKTNPDILNDQDENENNHENPGKSGNSKLLRESEDGYRYDPHGQPNHYHLESRDDGVSRTEEDKDMDPSSNLPDREPFRVEKSEDKEDKDDSGRSESPYALMIQSQEEITRANKESDEIDTEDGEMMPGVKNLPSPPLEPIMEDDGNAKGDLHDNGSTEGRRNDSIRGENKSANIVSPSIEATEGGEGGSKMRTRKEPLVNDDIDTSERPEKHESISPDNRPGSGETSLVDEDTTPAAPPPSPSRSSLETDIEASGGIEGSQSSWKYASYLINHLDMLYYLWISPKKCDGSNPRGICNWFPFVLVTLLAVECSLEYIKDHLAFGDKELNIGLYYLTLCYYLNTFLLRICFVYLLCFKYRTISSIIKALMQIGGCSSLKQVALVVWAPLILTVIISICIPLLYVISALDDGHNLISTYAYIFSKTLFIWSDENFDEDRAYLRETYGHDLTATTVAMGVTCYSIKVIGYLEKYLVIDLCLALVFTLYILRVSVENDLERAQKNPTLENRIILWEKYKTYRDFSDMVTECFWLFFQFIHLENVLFVLYFLFDHVIFRDYLPVAIIKLIILGKMVVLYWLAFSASSISRRMHKWVQRNFRGADALFIEGPDPVTVASVLDELSTYPVGIGTGLFFIDQSFIFRFIGVIVSNFCFLSETAQDIIKGE